MIPAEPATAAISPSVPLPPLVVATDLDRTLLRDDRTVSQRTRDALDRAAERGALVVAVTARPIRWLPLLVPEFGRLPHVIASNGAVCYDLVASTPYDLLPFDPASLPGLVGRLHEALPDARIALETPAGMLREPDYELSPIDPDHADPGRRVGPLPELLAALAADRLPVLKIVVADRDRPSDAMVADALPAVDGEAEVSYSKGIGLLEIGPPGVTKASTLSAWCAARGIGADRVVAFGDMPNDLPMLRWAGRSFAVANAHPDVLAVASAVTGSNEEDGVAMVVEELFGG